MFRDLAMSQRRLHADTPTFPHRWQPLALAAALAATLLMPLTAARAQALPPQLPSAAEPGREPLRPPLPPPPAGPVAISVPQAAASRAPAGSEQLRFTLNRMQIEGASAYPDETLRPLYAELLGNEITVARAFEVAGAIELRYRTAGYVTTRVIVPQQTIEGGVFRIQVVEGFVSDVVIDAEAGPARAAVLRLLAPLRGVRPISIAQIERRLLLANDLPGLTVRATLEPSASELGGSVIVVTTSRKARDVSLSANNRTSPYLGSGEVGAGITFNAVGERADRLWLNARSSLPAGRSASVAGGWDTLASSDGLTFGANASFGTSHPGLELDALDVRSKVRSGQGTVTWPLIRSRLENLRLVGQLELRDVDTRIAGTLFTRDRLRIVRAGLSYDRTDTWDGINALRVTLHKGLDIAGASQRGSATASRVNGRPDFVKLTAELTRVQQLGARTSLLATMAAQWTPDALLASEEMALGGPSFGRAYNDGEIAADRGIAGSLELRHSPDLPMLPNGAQVYGYIDGGRLSATTEGAPLTLARSLASFGAGARINVLPGLLATLEVAKPISAPVRTENNKRARVFVTVNASF
jgi:hemolysin activation/secretion protein